MNRRFLSCFLTVLALPALQAQPFFKVEGPELCSEKQISFTPLINNVFSSYLWDFGNGVTSNAYAPPPVTYSSVGNYTVSLKVTSNTPFTTVDSVVLLQTSDYWMSSGLFCGNDGFPDFYLRLTTTDNDVLFVTPENYEKPVPTAFHVPGVAAQKAFKVRVWDKDYSLGCAPDDYMGEITVPANPPNNTVYQNTASALSVQIKTKTATTATFSYTINVEQTPVKPVANCKGDTLVSNLINGNQWFRVGNPTALAFSQSFKPVEPGHYYVQYKEGNCTAVSNWIKFPECVTVSEKTPELLALDTRISPNPTLGPLRIELPSEIKGPAQLRFLDAVGRMARVASADISPDNPLLLDVSDFSAGVYFVVIQTADYRIGKSFVVGE